MKKNSFSGLDKCLKPLLKKGVEKGVFSGAAIGLFKNASGEEEKLILCHGKTKKEGQKSKIKETTLFDLASLTKPLCTVLTILHMIDREELALETSLESLFGQKTGQILKKIKIKHLLSHSSGLKPYVPYYLHFKPEQKGDNKNRLLGGILKEKTVYKTGENCVYSDLGYILLGEIIEKVSGKRLNTVYSTKIVEPIGLEKEIFFRPLDVKNSEKKKEIAATQYCPWRKRVLQGEVDDEHCWLMNGVAGHAGLFGTVKGVLELTAHILRQWQGREKHPSYSNTLLKKALTRAYDSQTWCLGFDTPSPEGSSGGKHLSKESVGHLGFTGTSFWIDPVKEVTVVLLTNRVHPNRNNDRIKKFRPQLHDTIFEYIQKTGRV